MAADRYADLRGVVCVSPQALMAEEGKAHSRSRTLTISREMPASEASSMQLTFPYTNKAYTWHTPTLLKTIHFFSILMI
jgi:hypothetical protein